MQRWPDTFILTRAPQSRSDRCHFAAPLTSLTERQRRLRCSDCGATRQSEADRQPGSVEGTIGNSARPRARTRAKSRKTANSARPRARTQAKSRKTANSARPRARTWAQPQKTTNSASPDPRARTPPRHQPVTSASPDPGARTQPRPRKTDSTSALEELPHRPT
jgi:sRNA-binding protein